MEGLIKGLVDVAIGHNERRNADHDNDNNSESYEERSRSTWAEVVSGEQDGVDQTQNESDHHGQRHPRHDQQSDQWNRVEGNYGGAGRGGDYGGQYRPQSRPDQSESQESYWNDGDSYAHKYDQNIKEENEGEAGEWQTVQKKKPQKIHMDHWNTYKRPSSEQEYSEEVQDSSQLDPSDEELSDFSQACSKLWELDFNRLVPGKDYEIDCGEGKKVYGKEDMAAGSLFSWLENDVFRKPTISRFCALLDNYNPNQGCRENVTEQERQEQAAFVEEISRTAPIKYLYKYLSSKGIVSRDYDEFKGFLIDLWFGLHGRGGTSRCSSAFEHVFVGEIKQRADEEEVSGFHNWLQFYLEEAKGNVDYQGYILPRRRGECPDSETQLLTLQFEWNGILKSVSSTFIGVSPEFEVALYTLCFFVGGEDNRIQLGPYQVNIKCYHMGNKIGSVFPIAEN